MISGEKKREEDRKKEGSKGEGRKEGVREGGKKRENQTFWQETKQTEKKKE